MEESSFVVTYRLLPKNHNLFIEHCLPESQKTITPVSVGGIAGGKYHLKILYAENSEKILKQFR